MILPNKLSKTLLYSAIGLIIICALFLPISTTNLWWREALNSGHVILFVFVSFALYSVLSTRSYLASSIKTYLAVLVIGLLLGVAVEILQGMLQREASIEDLYKNIFGLVSGLGFVSFTQQKIWRKKILLAIFSFGFLLLGTSSLFQISWDYLQRDKAFPSITALDEKWFASFYRFNKAELLGVVEPAAKDSAKLYRLRFDPGKYPGINIIEPEENWSAYGKLRFIVFSANKENIELILRVHDKKHNQNYNDRYNERFVISPGQNDIAVNLTKIRDAPADRELNLHNIAGVQLFLNNTQHSLFLELSDLFLEK